MFAARRSWRLVAVVIASAACGRGLPPSEAERAALAVAKEVAPAPSAGCSGRRLGTVRGVRRTLAAGGEERGYLLDAPAAGGPVPVVLAFHGFRASARGLRWWTGWGQLARRDGFIAVHPEGHDGVALLGTTGRGWDMRPAETRDVDFVRALLDRLERERCVDRRRIFATGMSNGGFFANLLGCALAERLAAIAPVAGALDLGSCVPARPMPVLLLYGRADRVVPAALIAAARAWWVRADHCATAAADGDCEHYTGCAADLVYCEGPQAHRWPVDATERIWRFFQAHPAA